MNDILKKESAAKKYLLYVVLKGYPVYQKVFRHFAIRLTEDPRLTAAVDSKRFIVLLNAQVLDHIDDPTETAKVSMLIRHEMLHVLLNHTEIETRYVVKKLGYDYHHLTREQVQEVRNIIWGEPSEIKQYPGMNGARVGNIAGDIDLSRFYIDDDIPVVRAMGALLAEDRPGWLNYSFSQLRDALEEESEDLKKRLRPVVDGTFDANGVFITDDPNDKGKTEFTNNTHIANKDVLGVTIIDPSIDKQDIWDIHYDSLVYTVTATGRYLPHRLYYKYYELHDVLNLDKKLPDALSSTYLIVQFRHPRWYNNGLHTGDVITFGNEQTPKTGIVTYVGSSTGRAIVGPFYDFAIDFNMYLSDTEDYNIKYDDVCQKSLKDAYNMIIN